MFRDYDSDPKAERRVFKAGISRQDVIAHAATRQWVSLGTRERTDELFFQYAWRTGGGDARVFYVEDDDFGIAYLEAHSLDAGVIAREMAAVEADPRVPVFSDAEVFALAGLTRTPGERIHVVYLASLAGPVSFDPAWMPLYERAAQDGDAEVRRASLYAMDRAGWPEFRPLAERLAAHDPDPEVRDTASRLRGIFDGKYDAQAPAVAA